MQPVLSLLTALLLATGTPAAPGTSSNPGLSIHIQRNLQSATPHTRVQVAQSRNAEWVCVDAVQHEGYRVNEILRVNSFSGGQEVVMAVQSRRETLVVGCDYATNTGEVSLYRLEEPSYNPLSRNSGGNWQGRFYQANGVRSDRAAADIARAVVGEQLGIDDPYSNVVQIDRVRQDARYQNWVVEGRVNGAPFVVQIRDSDAYILGFDLY